MRVTCLTRAGRGGSFLTISGWISQSKRHNDAAQRPERSSDPDRARNANGPHVPLLLAARAAGGGTSRKRMPAGAGENPVGTPARLSGYRRALRPDRRVLRAPRRVAVVRQERRVRPALSVSWLEIRRDRAVHRGSLGAGGKRLLSQDQTQVLSAGRARRCAVDVHGSAREAAAA